MLTLEPYQEDAAAWLSKMRRGLIISPAGSGKTIMGAATLDRVLRARPRPKPVIVGVICNTREQVSQWEAAFAKFESINRLAFVQIACAAAATDWSGVDCLLCDEAHHAGSAEGWRAQIQSCQGALWGFTATPPDEREKPIEHQILSEMFVETYRVDRSKVKSRITPALVRWLNDSDPGLKDKIDAEIAKQVAIRSRYWSGDPGQLWGQVAWQVCCKIGIVENQARSEAAIRAATNEKPTIVLVNQVEHGEVLAARLGSIVCHSGMGAKKRRNTIESFRAGDIRCIVATNLLEEGFDAPIAEVLVIVAGGRSARASEQRSGRVLRKFSGKTHGQIFDFRDEFHGLTRKHSIAREQVYAKLGYGFAPENGASSRLL